MIALFLLFMAFAVAIPVALEERRQRGDNVLKRTSLEIVHSPLVRRFSLRMSEAKQATTAAFGAVIVFVLVVLALFRLIGAIIQALF